MKNYFQIVLLFGFAIHLGYRKMANTVSNVAKHRIFLKFFSEKIKKEIKIVNYKLKTFQLI